MTAFRRVVIGFDGSDPAGDALALAQRLADPGEAELLLACVDAGRGFRLPRGSVRRNGEEVLAAGLALVGGALPATGIAKAAASAARGLTEIAEEQHADLLVLGAHHETIQQRTTPGPTALRLLQGAPCAVAVAPLGLRDRDRFHHVGVAYDGSAEAEAALAAAYAVAARDGAAVSLFETLVVGVDYMGIVPTGFDSDIQARRNHVQEQLDAAAEAAPAGVNPRTVLLRGEPGAEIARAADGIVDLLICGSRGYGPLHRVLAGSVSQALLLAARHPLVVLPRASVAAPSRT